MTSFIFLLLGLPVFASKPPLTCDACLKAESLVKVWDKAKTPEQNVAAFTQSQSVLDKLAKEIKTAPTDVERVRATVRLFAQIYAHDQDPADAELEKFRGDFEKPAFRQVFEKEYDHLPAAYRKKLMAGLMAFKAAPDLNADPQ